MSYKDYVIKSSKIITDVMIIKPSVFWDLRGNIYSSFNKDFYKEFYYMGRETDYSFVPL